MIAPSAGVLSPRGKVLERGMPRFFRRLAEGVFDLEDLRVRTDDLAEFLKAAAAHYQFDVGRLVAVGFSNGANIGGSLLLLRPDVLRAGILIRAMVPLVPEPMPSLSGTHVLISNGQRDPIVFVERDRTADRVISHGWSRRVAGVAAGRSRAHSGGHYCRAEMDWRIHLFAFLMASMYA